eukprot:CAMPEP_0172804136 /NCGR_PEP_ID=MMETSP1075-20121228/4959_1 /TAXON_ID=2916 /ORGANISM="Ceratium fusus, Strain PA161109" /LENGTH=58 /DNA_ID=CAMNT_0013642659 /DNA_START=345 /DNA_END=518 /DNA_ORIENTATION=+
MPLRCVESSSQTPDLGVAPCPRNGRGDTVAAALAVSACLHCATRFSQAAAAAAAAVAA